jgi:23S rRNA (adenine2503-C2)-methyltransferase
LRERLIPSAKKWKLPAIIAAVKTFAKQSSRDVTIEYCLINNVNDSKKHARELADLLKGISCKVNLIPLNPSPGFAASPPPRDRVTAFKDSLERQGIAATIRVEKGNDIDAACGQLRSKHKHNSETEDIQ